MTEIPRDASSPGDNPLRLGLARKEAPDPCVLVIFGATGDLSHRKLFPALFDLASEGQLPTNFAIVGVGMSDLTVEQFREEMHATINQHSRPHALAQHVWDEFGRRITLLADDFTKPECYDKLKALLEEQDKSFETGGNRLFFMSIPPTLFKTVFGNLYEKGLLYRDEQDKPWT
ncbi:MAG: glucose-6-phosphate dehydrogenase, partial [Chloroflexi bacterium]|nr:glucose-6-phosphate dehydrogenase [Chloroflexota bacterium]